MSRLPIRLRLTQPLEHRTPERTAMPGIGLAEEDANQKLITIENAHKALFLVADDCTRRHQTGPARQHAANQRCGEVCQSCDGRSFLD